MEDNKGRKEKIYEGIYKMAGAIQDDKDRFPLFNRVKKEYFLLLKSHEAQLWAYA